MLHEERLNSTVYKKRAGTFSPGPLVKVRFIDYGYGKVVLWVALLVPLKSEEASTV